MSGKFDYMMMQLSDPTIGPAAITGGKAPGSLASQPGYANLGTQYDTTAWSNPDVAGGGKGGGFVVSPDDLRSYSGKLKYQADQLNEALSTWQQNVGNVPSAVAPATGFNWPQAEQLASAITKTHQGVSQFVTDLVNAHHDMAQRLSGNADNYDNAEQTNVQAVQSARTKAIQSALNLSSPSASSVTQVGQNGLNISDPTAQNVGMINKLINMNGGNQPTWNSPPFNITANTPYSGGSAPKVSSQQLIDKLNATEPGTVSSAAQAYDPLTKQLAEVTGYLSTYGQNLAGVWEGPNAVTAVSQMQQLHQTATDLQTNALSAQQTLGWYGQVLSAYQANPPKPVQVTGIPSAATNLQAHVTGVAQQQANNQAADQAAQQYLASLNGHIETAYTNMPPQLNKNLPPPIKKTPSPSLAGGSGGPGGTGGSMASGGSPGGSGPGGPGGSPVPGVPPVPSGTGTGGSPGPGGSTGTGTGTGTPAPTLSETPPTSTPPVSSVPPVSTTPSPGSPGTGPTGPSGSPLPGVPGLPGTGTGTSGDGGVPGEGDVPGSGGLGTDPAVGVPGATGVSANGGGAGDPAGADGVGPDGVSVAGESPGSMGMPGMGGFGGAGGGMGAGQGRTRQAWESEDQGLWDPQEESGLGDAPLVSSDGMIGADALPGDWAAAGTAGFGPVGGVGASGGFGADGGAGFPGGAGGSAAAAEDGGGFPMMGGMGGGGRRDGSDRQRQAWMHEDADIWGEEADRRVPPVIG